MTWEEMKTMPMRSKSTRKGKTWPNQEEVAAERHGEVASAAKAKAEGKAKPKPAAKRKCSFLGSVLKRARRLATKEAQAAPEANVAHEHHEESPAQEDVALVEESSEAAAASSAALAQAEATPAVAREAASESSAPRTQVHKSPKQLLSQLAPPMCTMGLNYNDHRFTSSWKIDASHLPAPFSQKTKDASFANIRSWKEALVMVHLGGRCEERERNNGNLRWMQDRLIEIIGEEGERAVRAEARVDELEAVGVVGDVE